MSHSGFGVLSPLEDKNIWRRARQPVVRAGVARGKLLCDNGFLRLRLDFQVRAWSELGKLLCDNDFLPVRLDIQARWCEEIWGRARRAGGTGSIATQKNWQIGHHVLACDPELSR